MPDNIVHLDISKLDSEILDLETKVLELNAARALKVELREYIRKNAIASHSPTIPLAAISYTGGISEFIKAYLAEVKEADSKTIIMAYAADQHVKYEDVSNNISNALSRLKGIHIEGEEKQKGNRKAGYKWFLKTT